ncbi:MAG TPA: ferredoxin [Candidatus Limnocylindrales bacterium]|nr:ferredoxin [Candidatus Limnocylindrales bacterium]
MSEHRLRVDWIRCEGYGLCGDYAPELVELDEWRYPILGPDPVSVSRLHDAQRIVDCCPVRALRLERQDAGRARGPRALVGRLMSTRHG